MQLCHSARSEQAFCSIILDHAALGPGRQQMRSAACWAMVYCNLKLLTLMFVVQSCTNDLQRFTVDHGKMRCYGLGLGLDTFRLVALAENFRKLDASILQQEYHRCRPYLNSLFISTSVSEMWGSRCNPGCLLLTLKFDCAAMVCAWAWTHIPACCPGRELPQAGCQHPAARVLQLLTLTLGMQNTVKKYWQSAINSIAEYHSDPTPARVSQVQLSIPPRK